MPTRNFSFFLLIAWLAGGVTLGQEHRQRRSPPKGEPSSKAEQRPRGPDGKHQPADRRRPDSAGWLGLPNPFRPSPADRGPLAEGEEEELLEFARQEMPRAYRLLMRVRARNPQAYQQHIERLAPRARHLRRVFARDADLGRVIIDHSENLLRLRRARDEWRRASDRPQTGERLRRLARRLLAQNVRLETRAIERWIAIRERARERDVEQKFRRLSRADALAWSGEPKQVRQKLQALQNSVGPAHERLIAELKALLTRQKDGEITRLRERLTRLRQDAVQEVDRRLDEYLESVDRDRQQRQKPRGAQRGNKDGGRGRRRSPPPRP